MATKMNIPTPGDYTIGVDDAELKKRLVGAEVFWSLDVPSRCVIHLAVDNEFLQSLSPGQFPEKMKVGWKGESVFQGYLTGFQQAGGGKLCLIYEDVLAQFKKVFDHSFIKTNSLQTILESMCGIAKTSADLKGDFSSQVPSFSLEGRSLYDHLQGLSQRFGFFFTADQKGDRVEIIRVGETVGDSSLNLAEEPHQPTLDVTSDQMYDSLKMKYFDSKDLDAKKQDVGQGELYSKVGAFKEHSTFAAKRGWRASQVGLDVHAADLEHFEGAKVMIPYQLSKMAILQESLRLTTFAPGLRPGQRLNIDSPVAQNLNAGKYFVLGCHYQFLSAVAKVTLTGVRA